MAPLLFLMLVFSQVPVRTATGVDLRISVLHVSVVEIDEVQSIIDMAGAADLFTLRQVGLDDFNHGSPGRLSDYDVLVFGLNDGYEGMSRIGRLSSLRQYVEDGGGIVWTHDTLDWVGASYGPDLEEPAGVADSGEGGCIPRTSTTIVLDHPIVREPFPIGQVGDSIAVQLTHTTGGVVTAAAVLMRFGEEPTTTANYYLTAHAYGAGRVVVDAIGHSILEGGRLNPPSVEESRLFVNALVWASGSGATTTTTTTTTTTVTTTTTSTSTTTPPTIPQTTTSTIATTTTTLAPVPVANLLAFIVAALLPALIMPRRGRSQP